MKLQVLGSNSKGNTYILTDKRGNSLILELGVNFKEIQKALNHDLSKVCGCLVTHEHGDHAKFIKHSSNYGINVFATKGTFEGSKLDLSNKFLNVITYFDQFKVGDFICLPFDTQHDVNEPCGFLVYHHDMGQMLFLTDTTYCKYQFDKLDHVLIETNYSEDYLQFESNDKDFLKNRIVKSHMSIETAVKLLHRYDLTNCKNIVLLHLSDRNGNPIEFKNTVNSNFGINTVIAEPGLQIDLYKNYF